MHWQDPQPATWDSSARGRLHWYPSVGPGPRPTREYACGRYTAPPTNARGTLNPGKCLPEIAGDPLQHLRFFCPRKGGQEFLNLLQSMHNSVSISKLPVTVMGQVYHPFRSLVETTTGWMPNADAQPLPKAGATQERTLEAVGCSALFGNVVQLNRTRRHWYTCGCSAGNIPPVSLCQRGERETARDVRQQQLSTNLVWFDLVPRSPPENHFLFLGVKSP
jgi:hypothetical protein